MKLTLTKVKKTMRGLGYKMYDEPYKLNIIGIRSANTQPNKFDDKIVVFYKDKYGKTQFNQYDATTDTGTFYLLNPLSGLGAALLKEGQYEDSYKRGYHKGEYLALVQDKPVTVYRDYDRDAFFDFGTKQETGMFGINIHKAGKDSIDVDKWSAGCQVFKRQIDFNEFMNLTEEHEKIYGNRFTYALIDERAIKRRIRRNTLFALSAITIVSSAIYYFVTRGKK